MDDLREDVQRALAGALRGRLGDAAPANGAPFDGGDTLGRLGISSLDMMAVVCDVEDATGLRFMPSPHLGPQTTLTELSASFRHAGAEDGRLG